MPHDVKMTKNEAIEIASCRLKVSSSRRGSRALKELTIASGPVRLPQRGPVPAALK